MKGFEFMMRALNIFLSVVRTVMSWRLFPLLMRSDFYHLFPSLCLVMSCRLLIVDPYPWMGCSWRVKRRVAQSHLSFRKIMPVALWRTAYMRPRVNAGSQKFVAIVLGV